MQTTSGTGGASRGQGASSSRGGQGKGNRRAGNRGRGGDQARKNTNTNADSSRQKKPQETLSSAPTKTTLSITQPASATVDAADAPDDDDAICFICANVVVHHSIAPCNHTTCHICGLRMRALYKDKNCAHCRTPAPYVIFASDGEKKFEEYSEADFTTTDSNIGIKYAKEDIVGDTVLLLRYNCPDGDCDFAGLGWPDLHRHVKTTHKKRMCDLCTRNKRVFTHEHELFSDKDLDKHMRKGDDKPGAADQTGFKGHPLCGFCGERFYDDDKLYEHCRMKHERCFLCDRRDSRQPHYFLDYPALENHFKNDHFLCSDRECMEKKFIVFDSEMDLQAHQLAEHKSGIRSAVVDMSSFDVRAPFQEQRRGRGRDRQANRTRGRDQNAETAPLPSTQPLNRAELAYQRQMAIHSAQSVTNRSFGGQLSGPSPAPAPPAAATPAAISSSSSRPMPSGALSSRSAPSVPPAPVNPANMTPEERARHVRHSAVIERASNLLHNDPQKIATFRSHISSYRSGAFTAPQLVDSFFTLFSSTSSNALGTLAREVADLFEDKKKADSLRQAWQDWRAINEDYPSLPGLSGMHGATSSSSGWAAAGSANPAAPHGAPAQRHSNRVLKLKNSTRLGGPTPVSSSSGKPPGWNVAPAIRAAPSQSHSAFPALSSSSSSSRKITTKTTAAAIIVGGPSWTLSSSSTNPSTTTTTTTNNNNNTILRPRPKPTGENFPALPAAPKPTTTIWGYGNGRGVIRDHGKKDTGFQWGASDDAGGSSSAGGAAADQESQETTGGKKGKGKKKVLVQWG